MSIEKSNNNRWIEELNNLQQLPDESFDKNNAWEKLHNRLVKKKNVKKPFFLWRAAASVAVLITLLLLNNKNDKVTDKKTAVEKKRNNSLQKVSPVAEKEIITEQVKTIVPPESKKAEILIPKKQNQSPEENISISDLQLPHDILKTPENIAAADTNTKNTVTAFPATAETKKKLRVVHNNELGYQPTEVSEPEKKASYAVSFIPGKRRIIYENTEDNGVNTLPDNIKPKKSILHFGSFISQKQ
jgi:hypothetical protein